MNDNQVINLNIGLNWADGSDNGQFDYDDALWLLGVNFATSDVKHEPYVSSWDDGERTYTDHCIAVRITVPTGRDYDLRDIIAKVDNLRIILKQDAIAYDVWGSNGGRDSDVYYGPNPPSDKLEFDPSYFRYL